MTREPDRPSQRHPGGSAPVPALPEAQLLAALVTAAVLVCGINALVHFARAFVELEVER